MRARTSSRLRCLPFVLVFASMVSACGAAFAQAPEKGSILVLPFLGQPGGGGDWMGRSIQQDLLADLTQGTAARILAPANLPAAADPAAALQSARSQVATWVVFGQVQVSGAEVRITGQVLDVTSGKPLGALKATGPTAALFHLEDATAGEVFVALPRTVLTPQTLAAMERAAAAQANQQNSTVGPGQTGTLQPAAPQAVQPQGAPVVAPQYTQAAESAGLVSYAAQPYYPAYPDDSHVYPDLSSIYGGYCPPYTFGYPECDLWPGCDTGLFIGGFGPYGGLGDYGRRGWDGRGFGATGRFGNRGVYAGRSPGFGRAAQSAFGRSGMSSLRGARTFSPSRAGGFRGAAIRGGSVGGGHAGGAGRGGGGGHR
jgi:TolB-like protein